MFVHGTTIYFPFLVSVRRHFHSSLKKNKPTPRLRRKSHNFYLSSQQYFDKRNLSTNRCYFWQTPHVDELSRGWYFVLIRVERSGVMLSQYSFLGDRFHH